MQQLQLILSHPKNSQLEISVSNLDDLNKQTQAIWYFKNPMKG